MLRQIHVTAGYWLFLLGAVHLGMQWTRFAAAMKKQLPSLARIRLPLALKGIAAVIILVFGGMAFAERDVSSRLFMVYAFDFFDDEQPAMLFLLDYASIFAAFTMGTHLLLTWLSRSMARFLPKQS